MGIINLGSLNLDKVYGLERFVLPGETTKANSFDIFPGGKGLNQSIALARAGAKVFHVGMVGADGNILLDMLKSVDVNIENVIKAPCDSGHAVIQIDSNGQNCIIVCPGANDAIEESVIDRVLTQFSENDYFLTQNETACVGYAISAANNKGLKVILNPSPITEDLLMCPLEFVDLFVLNEIEAAQLSGLAGSVQEMLEALTSKFPRAEFLLTVGENGAYYKSHDDIFYQPASKTKIVDTTAAGDTFTGYFLAMLAERRNIQECLEIATKAAGIAVSRQGAAPSIPERHEII